MRARVFVRSMGSAPKVDSFANIGDLEDADHKQWVESVKSYPVSIPHVSCLPPLHGGRTRAAGWAPLM